MSHDPSPAIPAEHATLLGFSVSQEACPAPTAEVPCSKPATGVAAPLVRPEVRGKFLFVGDKKLFVRGVTYGTFRPNASGEPYPRPTLVERDFAAMAAAGINAVRVYTVPPRWLLDSAAEHGLRVMVGLPWEQHVAFLEDQGLTADIVGRVRDGVRRCAGHPALLCYAVGNEVPAPIVRWYGPRRVERFLGRLYEVAKTEDPSCLVTYVNYPTTEYLELPFVDFLSFNVYLETQERLTSYLKRVHNIAGQHPVLMAEIGLDGFRHGDARQAEVLDWQVRTAFAAGCCGAFVFAWTDEWYRGGYDIEDWRFGLTTRERCPKPVLGSIRRAFSEVPAAPARRWPRISVVICSYNGVRTVRDTLDGLQMIDYPDFEVIVVDDGSTDETAAIAREYPVRLIRTANHGLSCARNVGLEHATGEIVAYTDDDARPDPHWLTFLATAFMNSHHVGIGGPNIAPPGDGRIADCVANAPGGPVHVLLTDDVAEHIPGCNMAFRKEHLHAIGGFDPRFRAAGDDVDICWRMQERGWTIGFSPAALVWHHRRNTVRAYWRQQICYGKAEALLEQKWPEKYNAAGHVMWAGRIYGAGLTQALRLGRGRIYQGTWGSALFQSVYEPAPGVLRSLPLMPEWYLAITLLALLTALGIFWPALRIGVVPLAFAVAAPVAQVVLAAAKAPFTSEPRSRAERLILVALTAGLHLMQPMARLLGRVRHGLTPWRGRWASRLALPRRRTRAVWTDRWRSPEQWLESVEAALRERQVPTWRGGNFDRWDLAVRGGLFGAARALMAIEDHGAGQQYVRFRLWPRCSGMAVALTALLGVLAVGAATDDASGVAVALGAACLGLAARTLFECAAAEAALLQALPLVESAPNGASSPERAQLPGAALGAVGTPGGVEL
jgi:O-antigen biosynthesis protein